MIIKTENCKRRYTTFENINHGDIFVIQGDYESIIYMRMPICSSYTDEYDFDADDEDSEDFNAINLATGRLTYVRYSTKVITFDDIELVISNKGE